MTSGLPSDFLTNSRGEYSGIFEVNETGTYVFYLTIDDGAKLSIDGKEVINKWPFVGSTQSNFNLEKGWHTIVLEFF